MVPTGEYSDTYINIDDFAKRITDACNALDKNGYDVIKISEVIKGRYNYTWGHYGSSTAHSGAASTCYIVTATVSASPMVS